MAQVEGRVYDTIEQDEQPVWKSYLYQLQQKAPKPNGIPCNKEISAKPRHYGKEFHGSISREEADQLVKGQDGCYLVRESQRQPGSYTLTMRFGGASMHFRLYYDGMHYVGEKRFQSMEDLVADGLITMYMDTYAKDYIDTMMLPADNAKAGKEDSSVFRDSNQGSVTEKSKATDQIDAAAKSPAKTIQPLDNKMKENKPSLPDQLILKEDRRFSAGKRPSFKPASYAKDHNFKINSYKGFHWCDYCKNFLWGLTLQGYKCQDCGMNAHKQCYRRTNKDCMPDKKYVRRLFGEDLTTVVKLHDTKRPFVVDICVREVEERGLDSEGIYRVSGFADDIEALKNSFDKDGMAANVGQYEDINTITGVLKLFLRQLPLPLITFETYGQFIEAAKIQDKFLRIEALAKALTELPQPHFETIKFLMGHLYRVSQHKSQNMMSEENLSIVFGPTMMRSPEGDTLNTLDDLKFQRLAIELLISHQDVLFDSQ
ncbi:N-chimaerin-like [Actinia tenebrosa]|uniref:Beta-chimaerin n=1 Tax=Actinia tenebrosa TaxID=6105 RepID=A0A6P8J594_ACTTE|nr:N-chimaerin-like [Actinia tenebrosa]